MHLKNELAYMAQNYISSYSPSPSELKKYNILKNIRNNKIILLKPEKGNGIVILDHQVYMDSCLTIINNQTKFKHLTKNPTLYREIYITTYIYTIPYTYAYTYTCTCT